MTEACSICSETMLPLFRKRILGRYDVQYFHCRACGYVRTEKPYWLADAYSDVIAIADTGVMQRNQGIAARLACILYWCCKPDSAYVDVAGGYGILTRLMRDYGFDYYWEDNYCANLVARGFEAANAGKSFSAISAFEVVEHAADPLEFISDAMSRYGCRTFIFTTDTYSGNGPPSPDWWYLTPMTGQHISLFHQRTLHTIAGRLGLSFHSNGGMHILTDGALRNVAMLPVVSGGMSHPLALFVRRRLGSKTFADHLALGEQVGKPSHPIRGTA